ncbi:hypothetical protein PISL3812_06134 [Talaromyces islandicus]|uniref:Zn(2)-C6 fungal-type domain-containing protein n=1 Tax=Talaromyces islandicus TaxID=28573 RepID=A0A0U1M0P8_TALIS|nr:hypothetical protein PISL3812_06134 [Talaromyces islandicus]
MPSRRFHAKSRNGCFRCKTRKVKCDVQKPVCGHCSRRNEECIFPQEPTRRLDLLGDANSENDMSAAFTESHLNDWAPLATARPSNPDHFLLQNFLSRVTPIVTHSHSLQEIWALRIIEDGYSHSHLMHGMLAVSALHYAQTATTSKAEADYYRELAIDHHDYSVSLFRPMLTGLNAQNFDPLYASSILIIMFNAVFLGSSETSPSSNLASDIVSLCQLAKGVTTMRAQAGDNSKLYQHYRVFNGSQPPQLPEGINRAISAIEKAVRCLPDFGHGSDKKLVYLKTVALLRYTFYGFILNLEHPALLFVWIAMADPDYLDLLMAHDIMALRILAHYGICLLQIPDEWCLNNLGKNIVNGVRRIFELKMGWDVQHGQQTSRWRLDQKSMAVLPIHHRTELPS